MVDSFLWRRVFANFSWRQSQFLLLSTLSVCLPMIVGFSITFDKAAAVHELVTNETVKRNDMTSATRNLLSILL